MAVYLYYFSFLVLPIIPEANPDLGTMMEGVYGVCIVMVVCSTTYS